MACSHHLQWFCRAQENYTKKSVAVSIVSPSICHEVMGPDAIFLVFWMLSFQLAFSLSSFTFIKRLFSSSQLSAIRVVSPAYLRLLIFLLAILIPACASASLQFGWCTLHISYPFSLHQCYLLIWGYWYLSRQSWFQLALYSAQHFTWGTLHRS